MTSRQFRRQRMQFSRQAQNTVLGREGAQTRGMLITFATMTFWQRMRWVFGGVPKSTRVPKGGHQ